MELFCFIIIVFVTFLIWFVGNFLHTIGSYLIRYRDAKDMYEQIYTYYTVPITQRDTVVLDYFEEIPTLEYVELKTSYYYLKVLRTNSQIEILDALESFLQDALEKGKELESRNLMDYETLLIQQRELADYCSKVRMLKWNAEKH